MLEKITLVLLWLIPLIPALTAVWVGWSRQSPAALARGSVRSLEWTAGIFVVILALLVAQPLSGTEHWLSVRPLSLLMAALVLLIGWVVVRFSVRYMAGEPRLAFFYRWLLLTLASVLFAVLANHLLLLLVGWMVISLSLHRLLLFYPHRARTVLAAHKKFVIARIGELSLAVGFYILFQHFGTASIDQILTQLPSTTWSVWLSVAACCLVLTALLKCAQLPVHGWLIQVVDAPTPVSALLHAGVINLGGYLLILFAPLLVQSSAANSFLLIAAGVSLVLCALIMQTRVSIKVRLAWSTSAQMGFMLLECAMGLYELALLHLVAHSLYKAHAFLTAGHAVTDEVFVRQIKGAALKPLVFVLHFILLFGALGVAAYNMQGAVSLWLLLVITFSFYLTSHAADWRNYLRAVAATTGLFVVLLSWKWFAPDIFDLVISPKAPLYYELWCLLLIFVLLAVSWLLQTQQQQPRTTRWHHALFAGLYLDEWLTRITQRLWPIDLKVLPYDPFNSNQKF